MTMMSTHPSTDVAGVLTDLGVSIRSVGEREITGKCPVHIRTVGREDGHPSWSMNAESGLWICFSCGARGTLSMLIDELSGGKVDSIGVQRMLINYGLNRLFSPKHIPETEHQFAPEEFFAFKRVDDKRCHMKGLDPDTVFTYGVRWNNEHRSWAIPIISPTGVLQGWQEKKVGMVRNYPVGVEKGSTLFGVERFRSRTAILVESPLDVVRFSGVFSKPQALASFGAQISRQQMRLLTAVADIVVVALDNDKAGIEASKKLYKNMATPRRGIRWWNYSGTDAKDIGDMTDDEIEHGFTTATLIPPWLF